ncbi:hypothetical protein KJ903_00930 [Patescibacteria group bacterium]|nr:hypothetical protein [Patescibacteria group bacterium]
MEKKKETSPANYSLLKQIGIGVVTVISFILAWYLSYRFFYQGEGAVMSLWGKTTDFIGLFTGIFLVGAVVGLVGVLVEKWWVVVATYFLATASFFIFSPFKLLSLTATLFFLIVLVLTFLSIEQERKVRIRVSVYKILRRGFPAVLTMLTIVLAVSYYISTVEGIKNNGVQIPRQSFESSTGILEKYISEAYIPGFSKNMTVSEVSFQLFFNEVSKAGDNWRDMGIAPELESTLEAEDIDTDDNQAVMEAIQDNQVVHDKALELYQGTGASDNLLGSFGLGDVASSQPIIDAAYNAFNDKINDLLAPYRSIVPIAFAITFFLILQFFTFFIKWGVYGVIWLIFILLKAVGFVKVVKVKKEVEEIKL